MAGVKMPPMPREKLTPTERRQIVLDALSSENKVKLAKQYGVARSWLYALLEEATSDPQSKLAEAKEEHEFRQKVAEITKNQGLPREERMA